MGVRLVMVTFAMGTSAMVAPSRMEPELSTSVSLDAPCFTTRETVSTAVVASDV